MDLQGRSTLKIIEPINETIADTDISTIHVSEYSAPTPEGGLTAELVDYACLDPENSNCKGKYGFHRGYMLAQHPLYHSLAAGCAGIVFSVFETTQHEPEKTLGTMVSATSAGGDLCSAGSDQYRHVRMLPCPKN